MLQSSPVSSPFVYEEPVRPADLAGRDAELRTLVDRATDSRNSRLEGPRRFGKTSLLRAALAAAEKDGAVSIEVNFLGCVTAADVADRIERAYGAQLDGAVRRWFDGLVRTLQPTLSAAPGGVGVSASPQAGTNGLLDRLALPRRVQERTGRRCVIAFDEFQEVVRIDARLPGVFRSELESHADAAAYVFSGSHPGLMRDLFSDRRHAFFGQATPVRLGPLRPDDLAEHIVSRFAAGRREPGDGLGPLLDLADGHPQRAMLLAHHLYANTPPGFTATIERWTAARRAALRECEGEIQVLWQSASTLERKVLKVIAHRAVALTGGEAAQRFGLAKSGSTQLAVDRLAGDGQLVADTTTRSGWRVVDPFLAAWLREED
ncbi:hypothetical protein BH20ACT16_BH20ACT16_13790 [soil metagenome]